MASRNTGPGMRQSVADVMAMTDAERIVFTMDEGTITTYVQISYTGRPEDFAWVLPMPAVPKVDTAEMRMFTDLDRLTQPVYIAPRTPATV